MGINTNVSKYNLTFNNRVIKINITKNWAQKIHWNKRPKCKLSTMSMLRNFFLQHIFLPTKLQEKKIEQRRVIFYPLLAISPSKLQQKIVRNSLGNAKTHNLRQFYFQRICFFFFQSYWKLVKESATKEEFLTWFPPSQFMPLTIEFQQKGYTWQVEAKKKQKIKLWE